MISKPMTDDGQILTTPSGKVIGFVEGKDEFEALAAALSAAGYPPTSITSLYSEDGIHLLERLQENSFFFADSEDGIIKRSIKQLRLRHYAVAIQVADRDEATAVVSLAKPHGGYRFTYFGTWVSEQISV
jgi:hypothetical protein